MSATRYDMFFGSANAGLHPTFDYFARTDTWAPITAPPIVEAPAGYGAYYFDFDWSTVSGILEIAYQITLAGITVADVILLPPAASTAPGGQAATDGGPGGSASLASLRLAAQQESDTENDPHISTTEWNSYINRSLLTLYGLLVREYGEDYYIATATITTDGVNAAYPLPNGALYGGAPVFFKGVLAELISGPAATPANPITLSTFNLREKNRFNFPGLAFVAGPYLFPRYRLNGSNILFAPLPTGGLQVRIWYAPRLNQLVLDTDVADDMSGWLEYVVVDAAIKAIQKQERDPGLLVARRTDLREQIVAEAANRNIGDPNTVTETQGDGMVFPGTPGTTGTGGWF